MTVDLDALEKLADEALPYWGAVDMALGGNPIAADLVAPFAASVSPATIKVLIAEVRSLRERVARWEPSTMTSSASSSCGLAKAQGGE